MHDSCITMRIDLNVYISIIMNLLYYLRKSFILIELNLSYFLWLCEWLLYNGFNWHMMKMVRYTMLREDRLYYTLVYSVI